jgi:hypothetical protein
MGNEDAVVLSVIITVGMGGEDAVVLSVIITVAVIAIKNFQALEI